MMPLILAAALSRPVNAAVQPLRPPNGTYVYSMGDGTGPAIFTSTIVVKGSGSIFDISETTKLPNGAVATTKSTWSSATLLPMRFEVHQGKVTLRANVTPAAVTFIGRPISFGRIQGTGYVLPSVGLIANSMMLPYVVTAHPHESLTLAEIQNNQTVLIQPATAPPSGGPAGDVTIGVIKDKEHGNSADQEQIVTWLNRKTGIMDGGRALPGDARITLLSFKPNGV